MIGEKFNYNDVFFRDLTVAVLDILEGEIYWTYNFSSGDKEVVVPFYYSKTGDEKFLLDAFTDDIASDYRKVELNTDSVPMGILRYTGYDAQLTELKNPNVWLNIEIEDDEEFKKVKARIRPIPVSVHYELTIILNSENDAFKCSAALMDTIGVFRYLQFQHNSMCIYGAIQLPESNQFESPSEINSTTANLIKITANFDVLTVYPAFRRPKMGNKRSETDAGWSNAYTNDKFKNEEVNIIEPRKTKWYTNIYKANGNADNGEFSTT